MFSYAKINDYLVNYIVTQDNLLEKYKLICSRVRVSLNFKHRFINIIRI